MGLRDDNPFIEQDLHLIITSFEKSMVKSRDIDSVFVGGRRKLETMKHLPKSTLDAIGILPSMRGLGSSEEDDSSEVESPSPRKADSQPSEDDESSEEGTGPFGLEEFDWEEEVKRWGEECQPCDFRSMFEAGLDFEDDLKALWDEWDTDLASSIDIFEDLLDISDISLAEMICPLLDLLKFQCNPDLKKLAFVLQQLMGQFEIEMETNFNIIDDFLMSALEPIISRLAATLDLMGKIALGPVQCIIDEIQRQMNQIPQNKAAFESAFNYSEPQSRSRDQAEEESAAMREEVQEADRTAQQRTQRHREVLDGTNESISEMSDFFDSFGLLKGYLDRGNNFLKEKVDWLTSQLNDLTGEGIDDFNNWIDFAKSKTTIMQFLSLLAAIIEVAENGELKCGPDAQATTEDEIRLVIANYTHPSAVSDISVEGDMVVVQRREPSSSDRDPGFDRDRGSSGDPDSGLVPAQEINVVVKRPIASCLKTVTEDQAEQTRYWIEQLDQEV